MTSSLGYSKSLLAKSISSKIDTTENKDHFWIARRRLIEEQVLNRGIRDLRVIQAMLKVPRHYFVDAGMDAMAYRSQSLTIGEGQTISHPHTVALMMEALQLKPEDKVLEIGTGCGYQTALLAELVAFIYSVERIPNLLFQARRTLKKLKYQNIHLKLGDGSQGWTTFAPYDVILVAAVSPEIPRPYLEQLKDSGRLVLPVGHEDQQQLVLVKKNKGRLTQEKLSECRFVKLKGKYGF